MDGFILARVIHVIAVLLWIGGVAFVTLALMPIIRADQAPSARMTAFHAIERRFSAQAKLWVLLAGASGLWMVWRYDMWIPVLPMRGCGGCMRWSAYGWCSC